MRILIVMAGFFPGIKFGGPPVSVDNFCSLLNGYAECFIVTHNHDFGEVGSYTSIHEGWNDRGNVRVKYVSNAHYNGKTIKSIIRDIQPDYIYLQSLFQECVFSCLRLSKEYHIKTILAPRGELCRGAFHKKFKKLLYITLLRLFGMFKGVVFQSTSLEETASIEKYLGVPAERIHLLTNIPSIPRGGMGHNLKIAGEGRFVFISRIVRKKNLLFAIKLLAGINGQVVLDIYGPLEDGAYWAECENAIGILPQNVRVNYCGLLEHEEIHETFCQYDSFLFPTHSENYGHVIVESLLAECIPIISDQTPWSDMNASGAGWALPLSDEKQFKQAIQTIVDMDESAVASMRKSMKAYITKKLNLDELRSQYLDVFKPLFS